MRIVSSVLVAAVALCLTGCSAMLQEPAGITYAKSVEQLGITPVYPPREDIQVGDIWAIEHHTKATRLSARSAFIDSRNLLPEVNSYLNSRYDFSGKGISGDGLPINGFPQITVNSGVAVGLGGGSQSLLASFGFAYNRTLKMNLQFKDVVAYEIAIPDGMTALGRYCQSSLRCRPDLLVNFINQRYQLGDQDADRVKAASAMLITKVYMAKTVTYTFNDAQLAAAAAAALEEGQSPAKPPVVTQEQVDLALTKDNPDLVRALNEMMESSRQAAAAGGAPAVQVSVLKADMVSFSETFARPVVIGYEGVSN